ncbi:MAG: HflK protein, partial [Candidatus Omnitrophica bacterium CG07_land_8_20_14_0_80_50_8]
MENSEWSGAAGSFLKDLEDLLKTIFRGPVILVISGIVLVLWLASGLYMIGPGEQGVVRQFGKMYSQTGPGLRYHLPPPIQSRDVVNVAGVRRAEIGFRSNGGLTRVVDEESLMLTGDENIVAAQLFVQYVIKDPSVFLFRARDPEQMLTTAAEVALRN